MLRYANVGYCLSFEPHSCFADSRQLYLTEYSNNLIYVHQTETLAKIGKIEPHELGLHDDDIIYYIARGDGDILHVWIQHCETGQYTLRAYKVSAAPHCPL